VRCWLGRASRARPPSASPTASCERQLHRWSGGPGH
jgi:hypothetical protein